MKYDLQKLKPIDSKDIFKALELAEKENEQCIYGIEKEFAFTKYSDLYPVQKIGKHSAYKFISTYGCLPDWMHKQLMPEVFDYMIEIISEPHVFFKQAIIEISAEEAFLWKAIEHIRNEFPNIESILLSTGTLYKPANISKSSIPEVLGEDKRIYLEEMVKRYGEKLTPQGLHGNISIPEPLIAYQYHQIGTKNKKGSVGYTEFKNEVYVRLACKLRAFVSLILSIEANTPFDYVYDKGEYKTVITGYQSNRWLRLPQIESTNHPLMLRNYSKFQQISKVLIDKEIIIGANNYMPIRPKGERRLGEVPLSLERAAWFYGIMLDKKEIEHNPSLSFLSEYENESFIKKLQLADEAGWLKHKGFTMQELIKLWRKDNVRRLLGVPLNRLEIRCEEAGDELEFELAKAAFILTLAFHLFCNPNYASEFNYTKTDLRLASTNENKAIKNGLNAIIKNPFNKKLIPMRQFLKETLQQIENLAKDIGYFNYLKPIYELSKGAKNEAEKKVARTLSIIGKNIEKTKTGLIIVPKEIIRQFLLERKNYLLSYFSNIIDENFSQQKIFLNSEL